jgi:hypothetical protein
MDERRALRHGTQLGKGATHPGLWIVEIAADTDVGGLPGYSGGHELPA